MKKLLLLTILFTGLLASHANAIAMNDTNTEPEVSCLSQTKRKLLAATHWISENHTNGALPAAAMIGVLAQLPLHVLIIILSDTYGDVETQKIIRLQSNDCIKGSLILAISYFMLWSGPIFFKQIQDEV